MDSLFPDQRPVASAPWPHAGRRKDRHDVDYDAVRAAIAEPDRHVQDVDPRTLRATQQSVTRAGVDYYRGDEYRRSGKTFADQENPGNKLPFVYSRRSMVPGRPNDEVLLAGHHRASAALINGEQFRAIRIEGDYGAPR
jgi:hypothetical protein